MSSEATIMTRGEDVSDYIIGCFQDYRLKKIGALLFKKICTKMTTCIKHLAGSRALEVGFSRFLHNKNTDIAEIEHSLAERTNHNCENRNHVLCIQDTVEVNYPKQYIKKNDFGPTTLNDINGFFAHPGLIVDAENYDVLGLSSIDPWVRGDKKAGSLEQRPIEDKESYFWLETARKASNNISNAKIITAVGDRGSDIYELFDRIPNERTHLLVRACYDRKLSNGKFVSAYMSEVLVAGEYELELSNISRNNKPFKLRWGNKSSKFRQARTATMAVKYSEIEITKLQSKLNPKGSPSVKLTCVEVREISDIPDGEEEIFWRLFTTHKVNSFDDAKQIIRWYQARWMIEQIFRTIKKKGLNIEDSQIESVDSLLKLFTLSIAAGVTVMMLVNARDGTTNRLATDVFNKHEIIVLALILSKVEGKTTKQKNPHIVNSLGWASWIIARLGGWNGYACEFPPGPITMYRGLEKFQYYFDGWKLTQKDVCIA